MFAATSRCASMKPLVNRASLASLRRRYRLQPECKTELDYWQDTLSHQTNVWGERAVKAVEGLPRGSSFRCSLDGKMLRFCLGDSLSQACAELRLRPECEATEGIAHTQRRVASISLSSSAMGAVSQDTLTVVGIRQDMCFLRASISSKEHTPAKVECEIMFGDIFAVFSNLTSESEDDAVDKAIRSLSAYGARRQERHLGRSSDVTTLEEAAEDVLVDVNAKKFATVMLGVVTDPQFGDAETMKSVPPPEFTVQ